MIIKRKDLEHEENKDFGFSTQDIYKFTGSDLDNTVEKLLSDKENVDDIQIIYELFDKETEQTSFYSDTINQEKLDRIMEAGYEKEIEEDFIDEFINEKIAWSNKNKTGSGIQDYSIKGVQIKTIKFK